MIDDGYLAAATELADLRQRYAETFLQYRLRKDVTTDYRARAMADLDIIRDLTLAEARYELELARLRRGS